MNSSRNSQRKQSSAGSIIPKRLSRSSKSNDSTLKTSKQSNDTLQRNKSQSRSNTLSSQEEKISVISEKEVNYREELIFLFFSFMLDSITEECVTVAAGDDEDSKTSKKSGSSSKVVNQENTSLISGSSSTRKSKQSSRRASANSQSKSLSKSLMVSSEVQTTIKANSIVEKKNSKINERKSSTGSKRSSIHSATTKEKDGLLSKSSVSNELDWIVKTEDQRVKLTFKNGNVYEGDISKKLMHGMGIFRWADGTVYEGEFQNGYPHGKGTITLTDLSYYEGNFLHGKFHGYGVFRIANTPIVYQGEWKCGKKHGKGWLLYETNNWYDGNWFEDEKQGIGYRQYLNGTRYKGDWYKNMKHGQGSIVFENNDFYKGDWCGNQMYGYGEYTWNSFLNESLLYPYNSWYKGSWVKGSRTGVGLMNFGSECGAKLVGIWENNMKHGPGVMVCGNGVILESNPLFENDKPVHRKSSKIDDATEALKLNVKSSFQRIIQQINSKVLIEDFDPDTLENITKFGEAISKKHFLTFSESPKGKLLCSILKIPIHTISQNVELGFYIYLLMEFQNPPFRKPKKCNEKDFIVLESDKKAEFLRFKNVEEVKIRNLITCYLPELVQIYNQYAQITTETVDFKPVLIRMYLWQLYRDMELPEKGISLVESDLMLSKNVHSCVESNHYPFEPIYFWQFLQSLVGNAFLLFSLEKKVDGLPETGLLAYIFEQFLIFVVFPNLGKFKGIALTLYKDLLPMTCVYSLYAEIGEPHSARDFLLNTCVKKGNEPPCYLTLDDNGKQTMQKLGQNQIVIGQELSFIPSEEMIACTNVEPPEQSDPFFSTLYKFRKLGVRQIVRCLIEVCPQIASEGVIVNIEYKMTFIEFYEVLLLCARKLAEKSLKVKEKVEEKIIEQNSKSKMSKRK